MANVQSWLSRKARRAVLVAFSLLLLNYTCGILSSLKVLPEAPEVAGVEQLIQSLLDQEHQLISVRPIISSDCLAQVKYLCPSGAGSHCL